MCGYSLSVHIQPFLQDYDIQIFVFNTDIGVRSKKFKTLQICETKQYSAVAKYSWFALSRCPH